MKSIPACHCESAVVARIGGAELVKAHAVARHGVLYGSVHADVYGQIPAEAVAARIGELGGDRVSARGGGIHRSVVCQLGAAVEVICVAYVVFKVEGVPERYRGIVAGVENYGSACILYGVSYRSAVSLAVEFQLDGSLVLAEGFGINERVGLQKLGI